jgi:ribonuclease HI
MMDDNTDPFVLNIYSNNVHHTNHITHAILQAHANHKSKTDIIIITEPWIGTVHAETQEKGTVRHPDWHCITPASLQEMGVALYHRKGAPFRIIPLVHETFAKSCILPVRITMANNFSLLLLAVYNSPTTFEASVFLQNCSLPQEPTILCGDFNLHAPEWDSSVHSANVHTSLFQDWLMSKSFLVLNDPNKPTFHGHKFQYAKVDDLVIANSAVFDEYDVGPIIVHTDNHYASDHYPISFDVFTHTTPQPSPEHFTFSEDKHAEWVTAITSLFGELSNTLLEHPTPQSLDLLAEAIIIAFSTATQQTMHQRTTSSYFSRHWWNDDLSQTISKVRELARGVKDTHGNPYLTRQYEKTKAVFRAKVNHAKQTWATQRLEGATSKTVWEFIKWYKHGGKRCRPLYSTPSHVPAPTEQNRDDLFVNQFFPEPPPVQPFTPSDDPIPQRSLHPLTWEEVDYAIRGCRLKSTPGPSKVNYTAVKWAWEGAPDLLFYLFNQCIRIGHYPSPFKHSITTIVPKPDKPDYATPSSYRPIQLLECLGKILDKIIARRIQYEVAAYDLVPLTQFGGRIHSSTIDAGLAFVQDIQDAWAQGQKASALFFDISGFFNFVNHDVLIARLQHNGFSRNTIALLQSFLENRSTNLYYDGHTSETFQIRNGVPQGSPLSPILAIIYSADLQKLRSLIMRRIISFAYIDDGVILTFSSTLDINIIKLQTAFGLVTEWLTANGLKIQTNKLELMHFTKGPDPSSPTFPLPGQHPVVAPRTIRWLGFYLDQHLNFIQHTKIMAARATATIRAMGILGNTVRGMSHVQLRQLTLSTIIPVLTYGCQLWWGGKCAKTNTARLQTALNGALRLICRAFRTTSISALQHISHIPPLTHLIHKLCYSSSLRLHRLLPNSPVLQRITPSPPIIQISHQSSNTTYTLHTPPSKLTPLQRIAQLSNATHIPSLNPIHDPPWIPEFSKHTQVSTILPPNKDQREQYEESLHDLFTTLQNQDDILVIGTDGSRHRCHGAKHTGAGVFITNGNNTISQHSYGVGRKSNTYDGESLALMAGMRLAFQFYLDHPNINKIYFFSDNSSALTNITHTNPHPSQTLSQIFIKYAKSFLEVDTNRIVLQWVPGHKGFKVNEQADRLARRGCRHHEEILPTTLSYHAEQRSKLILKKWRQDFQNQYRNDAFREVTFLPPTTKPNRVFTQLRNEPELFGRLTQVRSMHGYNTSYYARFNIDQDLHCVCGHFVPPYPPSRIRDHTLHNCEAYDDHRNILSAVSRDHDGPVLLGSIRGLLATAKFLQKTGAFTSTGQPYEPTRPPDLPGLDLNDPT